MNPELDQRPDPEDGAHTQGLFWVLRASELLGALMFATALPWQQSFGWFGIIAVLSSIRAWHVNQPGFRASPKEQRRKIYRRYVWALMAYVGSAAFFLYVPGNLPMQAVLGCYLLANCTLIAIRLTGDFIRTSIALCLAFLPTSIRFLVDGLYVGPTMLLLLGIGGLLMTVSMIVMSYSQERNVLRQYDLRRRAETATDAVAAMGLAKSRFFAAVSHDLRQPVHAIGLYLEPLDQLSRAARNDDAMHAVEGIRQSWRALDDLLSQVLDLTRMDSGVVKAELQAVEVLPLVRAMITQHSAVAERAGIRLIALVKPNCFVWADELMLKRVLSNLLDNAIKFSPPGASVVVALRRAHQSAPEQWLIQVRDAGPGIDESAQARIFEEFVQLENAARDRRQGLGLGLAITQRFVLLMNGTITLRSAPGRGCCMTVSLPMSARPFHPREQGDETRALIWSPLLRATHVARASEAPAVALGFRDVLLVEDDPLVADAMTQLLQAWGLQVRAVATAAHAMQQSDFGQVAICDVRLPDGAVGLEVALQLRKMGKKVLLISGETHLALRESAQQHQLMLLTKPVSSTQLLAALQSL
jgi:two-component system, sensor histidine kinase